MIDATWRSLFVPLGEFLREQLHRIARFRAAQVRPDAPARLLLPHALRLANTRRRS